MVGYNERQDNRTVPFGLLNLKKRGRVSANLILLMNGLMHHEGGKHGP